MELTITPAAEKFMRRMLRFGGGAGAGFRLVVTAGGCSGLGADFSVETAPKDGDSVEMYNDMRLFLPVESQQFLEGVTIDFADTRTESGLVLRNPKAVDTGCGSGASSSLPGVATVDIASIGRGRPKV